MRLTNLVSIVTGGASGFGESICRAFTTEGARVVIADINSELGEHGASNLPAWWNHCIKLAGSM